MSQPVSLLMSVNLAALLWILYFPAGNDNNHRCRSCVFCTHTSAFAATASGNLSEVGIKNKKAPTMR